METEQTLKAGDVCLDCQQQGLEKHLRYFKLNLNGDTLLKCESNQCMYPYNDEMSSSSDEEENDNQNIVETNSLKFIDDFIQQYNNENEVQNSTNDLISNSNNTEQTTHFDISFLDNFEEINNENLNKTDDFQIKSVEFFDNKQNVMITENQLTILPNSNENLLKQEFTIENVEYLDNKNNEKITDNQFKSLPSLNSSKSEITTAVNEECSYHDNSNDLNSYITFMDNYVKDCKQKINMQTFETSIVDQNSKQQTDNQMLSFVTLKDENFKDCKPKIDIQSIETIKMESPLCNNLFTSTNTTTKITENIKFSQAIFEETTTKTSLKTKKSSVTSKKSSNINLNIPTSSPESASTSLDIPKANILKGSDLLKKLALADEKTSKLNTKMKAARNNKKVTNKIEIKKSEKLAPLPLTNDTDFSLDKLSEILIANKMKRESKNE